MSIPTQSAGLSDRLAPAGSPTAAAAQRLVGELPWIEDAGKIAPKDARELSKHFFDQLQILEEGTHEHQYARNTLIEMNQSLVRFAANRFRSRGNEGMAPLGSRSRPGTRTAPVPSDSARRPQR